MRKIERLILIYDADSGFRAMVGDLVKKLLRLDGCALCDITHGVLGVRQKWRSCRQQLGVAVNYLHRDEIPEHLKEIVSDKLPCVLAQVGQQFTILLAGEALERCGGRVEDFYARLRSHAAADSLEIPTAE